jgi:hypothetical protein
MTLVSFLKFLLCVALTLAAFCPNIRHADLTYTCSIGFRAGMLALALLLAL